LQACLLQHSRRKKYIGDETEAEKSSMRTLSKRQGAESDEGVSEGVSEGVNDLFILYHKQSR